MYVHGGGMILMGIDEMDADISRYVALSGVPFLSIGYRLAPEHPRPQAEDALDGYLWLIGHADELGIDAHRVAIMGDSGGAGIAAGAAILARDRGVPLAKQILIYPMLDDRTVACDDELDGLAHVWFAENNKMAWEAVLGERRGTDEVLPCEAPARNESFEGLAPAFLEVGELDLFRDETIEYAKRPDGGSRSRRAPCAHGPHAHLRHVPAAHCRQGLRVPVLCNLAAVRDRLWKRIFELRNGVGCNDICENR